MVAIAVRYFWLKPVTCNARQLLFLAEKSLARKSTVDANCLLQDALRSFLDAECRYYDRRPVSKRPPKPRWMARALNRAGQLSDLTYRWVVGMIELGEHSSVRPSSVVNALQLVHTFPGDSPYLVASTKGLGHDHRKQSRLDAGSHRQRRDGRHRQMGSAQDQ